MTSHQNNANDFGNDERLSAWLDGELSIEDRAKFEQQLSESPELRQRLDELRKNSDLVKGLPQEAAPDELRSAVMRAVERETLLPTSAGSQSGEEPRRNSVVVKLVSAAALIAVAVVIWINQGPQQEQFVKQDEIKTDSQDVAKEHANEQARVDVVKPVESVKADGMLLEKDQLTAANIGDFVKGLVRDGDSVAVVRLRVMDRQESIEALEVVLSPESQAKDEFEDGLVAVYIESGPEKLSEALAQMGKSLNRMELTSRIEISELDSDFVASIKEYRSKLNEAPLISRMSVESGSKIGELVKNAQIGKADNADSIDSDSRVRVIFLLNGDSEISDESL